MSSSQHPIALAIERQVGGSTRLLATVMCLPLVDGLFPALVLAGAVDGPVGILEVGLLVFGGSATVAVILADMDGGPREQLPKILGVGAVLVAGAAVMAALAPTVESLLNLWVFERFAAVVILAVAAKTASARIGDLLPRPAMIVALGFLASVEPANATLVVSTDLGLIARGTAAAAVGVAFAVAVSLAGPTLRRSVDLDRFRFGSAVALGMLPLSIFGLVPGNAPLALAVLGLTAVLAFDPDGEAARSRSRTTATDGGDGHSREQDLTDGLNTSDDGYQAPWL
ncbi:DUF5794 domain-containing protein [Halapricum salinum]|uniref:DUF5794 domain-containing protein n=1 Tax=Halapricum salinum TaxID=1457250 RepID=UPI000679D432|nr:DUF5794 domain-containing protein [Halapricum salinum]